MECVLRDGAFEGETHIVTGAAQGIGCRVAAALAAHGAQVTLVDLDEGRLAESLRRQQRGAEAATVADAFEESWARADVELRASRF